MNHTLASRIKLARKNAKLTQTELGRRVSVGQTTVQGWESGRNEPDLQKIEKIAEVVGISLTWLTSGKGQPGILVSSQHSGNSNRGSLGPAFSPRRTMGGDLPVRGFLKQGEQGYFFDNGTVTDYITRPAELAAVDGAYAMQLRDYSMPPFEPGWYATFDPTKPVRAGDLVAIYLNDGQAMFKKLVKINDSEVVVRQYEPAKDMTFKMLEVAQIHRFATIHAERP